MNERQTNSSFDDLPDDELASRLESIHDAVVEGRECDPFPDPRMARAQEVLQKLEVLRQQQLSDLESDAESTDSERQRHKQAAAILRQSVSIKSDEQRKRFLREACADDGQLRRIIQQLLLSKGNAGEPNTAQCGTTMEEQPGSLVGPYKLLQRIGEGGFGVIYMAEQTRPVRRKVAIKIIKFGMDTKEVVARFEVERQALALMDHPNIAKVLDAGTTRSGRPFFVMELVRGVPLTEFCDSNQLSARQRLKLFVTVCRAVQHAHQKGIIHRDLKPSNVMVTLYDNKPVPKVIDFGVAKAISQQLTEKTMFTQYGQMVGTPVYMSPEQAQMSGLDVDTRSDVYSLGVLLYDLLTGTTPLDAERLRKSGFAEMQRLIREEESPKPSSRLSTQRGDALARIAKHRNSDPQRLSRDRAAALYRGGICGAANRTFSGTDSTVINFPATPFSLTKSVSIIHAAAGVTTVR